MLILVLVTVSLNCSSSSAGIATSNIPVGNRKYKVIEPVEKSDWWLSFDIGLIGFPVKKPPIVSLLNGAVTEKQGDALINIRYWNDRIVLLFITINRIGIYAEAIKFEEENDATEIQKKRR